MATEGIRGLYVGTTNYGATAAFWKALGYVNVFETDHGSGTWEHPSGGPYLFIDEKPDSDLRISPILAVADVSSFDADFEPQHWGTMTASLNDPDGRHVTLEAPLPPGITAPDMDEHHREKYGES